MICVCVGYNLKIPVTEMVERSNFNIIIFFQYKHLGTFPTSFPLETLFVGMIITQYMLQKIRKVFQ